MIGTFCLFIYIWLESFARQNPLVQLCNIKQQNNNIMKTQNQKHEKASLITFLMGFILLIFSLYKASEIEMGALKENYLIVIVFSMVVILYSFFNYFIKSNK